MEGVTTYLVPFKTFCFRVGKGIDIIPMYHQSTLTH